MPTHPKTIITGNLPGASSSSTSAASGDIWDRLTQTARRHGAVLSPRRYKILVVDDELWAALDIEWVVNKLGHEVVGSAATAEEAIQICDATRPDLVLMDIRLGDDSDGIVAATVIRQRFDIPSLFVTSHGEFATRMRADAARPVGFVEKPFAPATLGRAISTALDPEPE